MKKLICLSMTVVLLLLSFASCQLKEDIPPVGTTANTTAAITTQAPVTTAPPAGSAPTLEFKKIQQPYSGSAERAAWLELMDLPDTLPTEAIDYDYLCGYGDSDLMYSELHFGMNLIISTPEELDCFCHYFEYENLLLTPDVKEILEGVDLTQQSILIVSASWSLTTDIGLKTLVWQDDALVAVFGSKRDGMSGDMAHMDWSYVVAVDKADLPAGGNTDIYYCIEFALPSPHQGYPNLYYPDDRYVFDPVAE